MDIQTIIILLFGVLCFGMLFFIYQKVSNNKEIDKDAQKTLFHLERIEKLMNENRKETAGNLSQNQKQIQERLDYSSKIIQSIQGELGKIQEITPHIQSLSNIFNSPKLRGGMGEKILESVLNERLPKEMWDTQYRFNNGETVDAIIKTQNGIIPIDSKFPLDNYRKLVEADTESEKEQSRKDFEKDVKKHITDISKKYILPEERTTNFAIIYFPTEALYYEAVIRSESLMEFAIQKNITPVSPNIFYHFLGVILSALQSQRINEQADIILRMINGIQVESDKFGDALGVLQKHISNSSKAMQKVQGGYEKLSGKIEKTVEIEYKS